MSKVLPTGARESNAGDQFHYLWAARRAIALLDPSSRLQRIKIEEFSPHDRIAGSPELTLGADIVEYYGGDTFRSADSVVVSQLKYSTRHPSQSWTVARLCAVKSAGGPSVISRLSQLFGAARKHYDRRLVAAKLRLRLVSNQPASGDLVSLLRAIGALKPDHRADTTTALAGRVPFRFRDELRKLAVASRLSDTDFPQFVRLIDVSQCAADARSLIEARLSADLLKHLPDDSKSATDALYRRIEAEALPERAGSAGLVRADILTLFDIHGEAALFPAPPRFEQPSNPIPTADALRLARTIAQADARFLIAHGAAGVGKTTTICQLENLLPPGTIVVPFDCFGNGTYLEPSEGRHLPERALLQLANELRIRCGTPLLIRAPRIAPDLWRTLKERLAEAAAGLAKTGRLLVLAIDAADNAVFAASEFKQACFIPDLWRLSIPNNVRIVVTARTHRVSILGAPTTVPQLALSGFDPAASAAHLRRRFTAADATACRRFHQRSGGNPRVQFYVLDRKRQPRLKLDRALADAARTPDSIFDDLVTAAVHHTNAPQLAKARLADLVCLARPARLSTFANATGLPAREAADFCRGLEPGVILASDRIHFRDEDFEKHLRGLLDETEQVNAHRRLADYFLTCETVNDEAAAVVAEHLFRSQQYQRLVAFTLDRGEPHSIRDPLARLAAYRRRLAFALRSALEVDDRLAACRLTILAGEAARSDSAIASVVRERPDLAMRHGDRAAVAEIYLRQRNVSWRGPLHLRVSAMYAREKDFDRAQDHMSHAYAWIRERRSRMQQSQAHNWELTADDIAAGAELFYWRRGLSSALRWLNGWRPKQVVFAAVARLAMTLADQIPSKQLLREISTIRLDAPTEAVFLTSLWWRGGSPPARRVAALAPRIERHLRRHSSDLRAFRYSAPDPEHEWAIRFAELAASCGVQPQRVSAILVRATPPMPDRAPRNWDGLEWYDLALRRVALEAAVDNRSLVIDDLLPKPPQRDQSRPERSHAEIESDQRQYREVFGDVLPAYVLRARVLANRVTPALAAKELGAQLAARRQKATERWATFDYRYQRWALVVADTICRLSATRPLRSLLEGVATVAELAAKNAAPNIWLDLCRLTICRPPYRPFAFFCADRAARYVEGTELPASERTKTLLRATGILDTTDAALSRDYFDRAVVAAAGIDDDSVTLLALHARLAERLAGRDGGAAPEVAHQLISLIESFEPKVSETRRIPYSQTLHAVAQLCPQAALAAATRWDDGERYSIERAIGPLVDGLRAGKRGRPRDWFWLLRLAPLDSDVVSAALRILEHLRSAGTPARQDLATIVRELSEWILRDLPCPTRASSAEAVLAWARASGLSSLAGVSDLETLKTYVATVQMPPSAVHVTQPERRQDKRDSLPVFSGRVSTIGTYLTELASHVSSDRELAARITASATKVAPQKRVAFLTELVGLPSDHRVVSWHADALVTALRSVLVEWRTSGAVMHWAAGALPTFVEQHFPALVAHEDTARVALEQLFSLPTVDQPASLLLRGLAGSLDSLDAAQLFGIADALSTVLGEGEIEQLLRWSVGRLCDVTALGTPPPLPSDDDGMVASFLFALFGNVDKRKRWRAAHIARALLSRGRQKLADELVALWSTDTVGAYSDIRFVFYSLSAKQWLLLVLARVATDEPGLLVDHFETLAAIATDTSLPHAVIRDMAKRAALTVAAAFPGRHSPDTLDALTLANEPRCCHVSRELDRHDGGRRDPRTRFHFDSLDTLPYWFEPLGRVFGIHTKDVARKADSWIVDKLGFTNDDTIRDRRELSRGERNYDKISNRHGHVPVVETLNTYLEFHSMLLVAGELVDEGQAVKYGSWDGPPGPWQDWLSHYVETLPGRWISDFRSAAPLEGFVYATLPRIDDWKAVSADEFDSHFLINRDGTCWVVVEESLSLWAPDRHSYVGVRAALVAPASAASLLRALQTPDDSNNFRLPDEGDDDDGPGRSEIADGEFQLRGFLQKVRHEKTSLEEHDDLRRIGLSHHRPGQLFQNSCAAQASPNRLAILSSDGRAMSETSIWSDHVREDRDRIQEQFTEGNRTAVPLDVMLSFLRTQTMDLIVEVDIRREVDSEKKAAEAKYKGPQHRVYLLRQDGSVETLEGTRRIRPGGGQRTRA